MAAVDDLIEEIFGDLHPVLRAEFSAWARSSRRFAAFATVYRAKVRAKLRNARDEAGLRDVRAELHLAALLLREERFSVEYERYAASKQRGPDFTVTFRTHTPFNVEVRRVRLGEAGEDADARATRLLGVLVDKVGQLPPSIVNLLWLSADAPIVADDLARAVATLGQLAAGQSDDYFMRHGYRGAADFQQRYRRLSGVVLPQAEGRVVWPNPQARHKTPPDIATAIARLSLE